MHNPFFAVDRCNAAFATFITAAGDEHFVVFTDRNRFDLSCVSLKAAIFLNGDWGVAREVMDRRELLCIVCGVLLREGHS